MTFPQARGRDWVRTGTNSPALLCAAELDYASVLRHAGAAAEFAELAFSGLDLVSPGAVLVSE